MIRDSLENKRILVTGATGFLGTALVERLLRSVPKCHIVVLIRPGQRQSAQDRCKREIIRHDCFDTLRAQLGDRFDQEMESRLTTISGDVGTELLGLDEAGLLELAKCDIAIHSAATVSFDAPLDQAVEVNLLGPSRVAKALAHVASSRPNGPAHMIAVSTAYVSGGHRGDAPEVIPTKAPFALDLNWEAEVTSARRIRSDAEAQSRSISKMADFQKQARHEIGAAGRPLLAKKAEDLRADWVKKLMVEAGLARAQMLGWPDAYAYTKSLGERALIASCGPVPISIVRPSIIESALAEPRPGWIRGFRMAEPVIISYARGLLKEFPGVPEGTVDVIPVDMVVATLIAVAAKGPDPSGPTVTQIASGSRNPLKYRQLVDLVRSWFLEHPLYDTHGQPIVVPEWSFPGRGRVQSQLERVTSVLSVLEKTVSTLPLRGKQASIAAQLETKRSQYERALGYVKLYGAYTETEACFRVDRLLELASSLDADDSDFVLDPAVIDWTHYVHDIHLPSIVVHARVKTSPGKKVSGDRTDRATKAILNPSRHLAAFDLENTLIASNVVDAYAWLATRHLDGRDRVRESMHLLSKAPSLLMQDRKDRGDFLRAFYRRYEGADLGVLEGDAMELFTDFLLTRAFPKGLARVRKHRELGHKTLLITGALDFAIEGLKPLFDDVVAAKMTVDESGILTGELEQLPPTGEARALVIQEYASAYNLELGESVAYADSASDLAMLEAVGFPVAVNPEAKLAAIARRRGWHVEQWPKSPGSPRRLLPIGPPPHPGQKGPWQGALGALGQAVNMASSSVLRSLEKRK